MQTTLFGAICGIAASIPVALAASIANPAMGGSVALALFGALALAVGVSALIRRL